MLCLDDRALYCRSISLVTLRTNMVIAQGLPKQLNICALLRRWGAVNTWGDTNRDLAWEDSVDIAKKQFIQV